LARFFASPLNLPNQALDRLTPPILSGMNSIGFCHRMHFTASTAVEV
jgi:hypothetical protein